MSKAFREGRLSYSKVRALTRIATAENEAHLVEMGLAGRPHTSRRSSGSTGRWIGSGARSGDGILFNDPRGLEVPATAETRSRGNVRSLLEADLEHGIHIDSQTTVPAWYGKRPDYDHILLVMNQRSVDVELLA